MVLLNSEFCFLFCFSFSFFFLPPPITSFLLYLNCAGMRRACNYGARIVMTRDVYRDNFTILRRKIFDNSM